MYTFFLHTRQLAQTGSAIPGPTIPLSNPVFEPEGSLYADLPKHGPAKLYVESFARVLDGWTGASLERVSFKYWGFEREFEGDDALMAGGYDKIAEWLEEEIVQAGGEIHKGEKVVGVEITGGDTGNSCAVSLVRPVC